MIYTDNTIPVKANTVLTREYWISQAKGVMDEYGNPFRVITLRWNWSDLNKTAEFEKTEGFEDAIISKNRGSGELSVRYRSPGSIVWHRPIGGVGGFRAECPVTPRNMKLLASCFPNKTWFIVDDDIRQIVEKMWEKKLEIMDPKTKKFNEAWFKLMHTFQRDVDKPEAMQVTDLKIEEKNIADQNLELARKKQDQDLREANLNEKEKDLVERQVIAVSDGKEIVTIGEGALRSMKLHELKKHYRKIGLKNGDNKTTKDIPEMIQAILEKQGKALDPEPVATLED
jgi:hypothetical protein